MNTRDWIITILFLAIFVNTVMDYTWRKQIIEVTGGIIENVVKLVDVVNDHLIKE
jgi:hypothetical protein